MNGFIASVLQNMIRLISFVDAAWWQTPQKLQQELMRGRREAKLPAPGKWEMLKVECGLEMMPIGKVALLR
jgi:hypothetical protein